MHPQKIYGCEVWRDLDWIVDSDKVVFDVGAHENLAVALTGVFDPQISGGKKVRSCHYREEESQRHIL